MNMFDLSVKLMLFLNVHMTIMYKIQKILSSQLSKQTLSQDGLLISGFVCFLEVIKAEFLLLHLSFFTFNYK